MATNPFLDESQDKALSRACIYGDAKVEQESALPARAVVAKATAQVTEPAGPSVLSLSGEWLMRGGDIRTAGPKQAGTATHGHPPWFHESEGVAGGWYLPDTDRSTWYHVRVPTTVQHALIDLGELPDPFWNTNNIDELERFGEPKDLWWPYRATRVEQKEWWFAKAFTVPPEWRGQPVRLYFDGVDYAGSFYLNGQPLGYHEGMFGGPTYDISRLVQFDEPNELVVRIDSAPTNWLNVMKGSLCFGYHYAHLITTGIWRDVQVQAVPSLKLHAPFVMTRSIEGGRATLVVEYYVDNHEADWVDVTVIGSVEGKSFSSDAIRFENALTQVPYGRSRYRTDVVVEDPQLWWPLNYGEQNLYALELSLRRGPDPVSPTIDACRTTFGIRMIEMHAVPDPPAIIDEAWWGAGPALYYRWQFVINGQPMFIKGACSSNCDPLLELDPAKYERILEMARRAGVQFFRAWGADIIQPDEFYRLCDEKGLMVYQEFCFHAGPPDFPVTNPVMVDQQVTEVVKRLRNHPSLIMWGGGNENPFSAGADEPLFLIGRRCRQYDPSRPYHRTDPWGGSLHNYYVFHRGEPMDSGYRSRPTVFMGEYGTASMTSRSSTLKYLPEEALDKWPPDEASRGVIAHLQQNSLRDIVKALRYADYGPVRDWDTYIEYTQMAQGDALCFVTDMQRAGSQVHTTGTVFFKFAAIAPGSSWAVVDCYGEPKLSYYRVKQVYQPQAAFATYEKFDWAEGEPFVAALHVANDTPSVLEGVHVKAAIFGSDLEEQWRREYGVFRVAANGREDLDTIAVALDPARIKPFLLAVSMRGPDGSLISDRWYWFNFKTKTDKIKELEQLGSWDFPEDRVQEALAAYAEVPEARLLTLPRTEIEVTVESSGSAGFLTIRNLGDVAAFNVLIENWPEGFDSFLDDNSFFLWPREERPIGFELGEGQSIDRVTVRAWNAPRVQVG